MNDYEIPEGYFPVYAYKHGISDGLLGGVNPYYQEDQYAPPLRHFYKEGYEFGMSLGLKQREMKEDEKWDL